ncbi:MAG: capsular polysaccharide synthesis protein [Rikenellaceae bacterium]
MYAFYSTMWWVGFYTRSSAITMWAYKHKKSYIFKYIEDNYSDIICKYKKINLEEPIKIKNYPIWVFWAQGFENAPELVKVCYANLLKHQENVCSITMNNYAEYVDIPKSVVMRVESGKITLIHFSDILRNSLLAKYGGLWVDSTCWLPKKIFKEFSKMNFVSPHTDNVIPVSRWCSWSVGTNKKNNILFMFVRDILTEHAQEKIMFIDYLLFDFAITFAYENFPSVKYMIDSCPENSVGRNRLHFMLNDEFDNQKYLDLIEKNWVFKLSYKSQWRKTTSAGKQTFYGKLVELANEN